MIFISCFASLLLLASKLRAREVTDLQNHEDDIIATTTLDFSATSSHCSNERRDLVFVNTVDGKLSCMNAINGQVLWTTSSSWPLISSSISTVKSVKDFADVKFIPSLDGNLYRWNGNKLENIPLSVDYLLGQLKRLPDGSFVTGGKEIVIYGVDLETGKLCYECSTSGCRATGENNNIKEKDIMLLRRIQNTVRVIDHRSGHEKWNFSVGRYEIEFSRRDQPEVPYSGGNCHTEESIHPMQFVVQEGIVTSTDPSSFWSFKFTSPIAAVWRMENDSLKPVDIFRYGLLEDLPDDSFDTQSLMYLGIHEGQMYIQKPIMPKQQSNTFTNQLDVVDLPLLTEWRPFISTSSHRTPSLNNEISTLNSLDYPYDNGFVLLSNYSTAISILSKDTDSEEGVCNTEEDDTCKKNLNLPEETSIPLSIRDWWKEIVTLSVILAIVINVGIRAVKKKLATVTETIIPLAVEQGTEEVECTVKIKERSKSSISISTETAEMTGDATSSEYNSRYLVDFDHLQCLGKGGFGVVFKAKKKIDDCEYAIKRIYLPQCDEAKEKMMREVKALAALDHPGIVRYFHAWWESPPQGWQMKTDTNYLLKDIPNVHSYALSHDWLLEVHSIFGDDEEEASAPNNNDEYSRRSQRKKTLSDDPLGKRYNFDTGIEKLISDHKEFDLLRHNDVFCEDDSDESFMQVSSIHSEMNEDDSFIVFEQESGPKSTIGSSSSVDASGHTRRTKTLTSEQNNDTENEKNDLKEKPKKRLVGKCCTRSSSCLTEPPLFLYIQMQLCKQATLKEWLSERTAAIGLRQSFNIFMQIINAVEYFHGQGMMHRDLKPANIFFSLDGSVKVGDFGLVTAITRPSKGKHKGRSFADENHTGQVGTQLYMSPEQATGRPYSQKVDIYSLGLILFELLSYFSTQMERMQLIYRLKHGILPDDLVDTNQGELVKMLTAENPNDRPEAKEIKEREFDYLLKNEAENIP